MKNKFNRFIKKGICAVMTATLLVSFVFVTGCSEEKLAEELIHSDYFTDGIAERNWITSDCLFTWDADKECINGCRNAVLLQTNFESDYNMKWDKFYASFDIQVRCQDEVNEPVGDNYAVIWITDNLDNDIYAHYQFRINPFTDTAELVKDHTYYDEIGEVSTYGTVIASAKLDEDIQVGEDAEWFNMGIRVTEGKLECYINEKLIFASSAEDGTEKIGDRYVDSVDEVLGTVATPVLFLNIGNRVALDNFEVWTPNYNFVRAEPKPTPGAVNDADLNVTDTVLK